jgi:hypothetical protein
VAASWLPLTVAEAADWEWLIAPYVWGSDIGLDLRVNDEPVVGADVSFPDLLDKTEMAGMVHVEGQRGKAGFLVDLLYLSVEDDRTLAPGDSHPALPGGTTIDSELETGIYEAAAIYRFLAEGQVLDGLVGVRIIDLEQQHDVALPPPPAATTTFGGSDTLVDGFVGARYQRPLGGRFSFTLRGDIGTGDTELTWNAIGTLGVRVGETGKYSLQFGWRHMETETEGEARNGADVETELTLTGPIVGFVFKL